MRTVQLPEFPGLSIFNFGRVTSEEAVAELVKLNFTSPGLGSLEDLKVKYPELYKHPEFTDHLRELGYDGLMVIAGLGSGWYSAVDWPMVGCFWSGPGFSSLWLRNRRGARWNDNCWFLGVAS